MQETKQQFDARDHWEALFDKTYLRWFDLNNEPALVEIVSVKKRVELTVRGGAKKRQGVIGLRQINGKIETDDQGQTKPMVLNVTNANEIAKIHGDKPSGWTGRQIVLFPTTTTLGRDTVGCIRVRRRREK